jgi:hypothetical protein
MRHKIILQLIKVYFILTSDLHERYINLFLTGIHLRLIVRTDGDLWKNEIFYVCYRHGNDY